MAYIIKNTSGLVNTRVTDVGRQKMSQGNFNISYFQVGDSEISYDKLPATYNQANSFILEPGFNSQNTSGAPQSNKQYVKYPYYADSNQRNTYGIPFMDSTIDPVFNRAPLRGFFGGITTATTINWEVLVGDNYVLSSNYMVDMSMLNGSNQIELIYSGCNRTSETTPQIGDIITIYYDGNALLNCECINLPTPTPTPSVSVSPTVTMTPTPTPSPTDICASPTPTPTPTRTPCLTPTPSPECPLPPPPQCFMGMNSCYTILTYRIIDVCGDLITLDRPTPDYTNLLVMCYSRVLIYPQNMTQIYDSITPGPHWSEQVINFESICDTDQFDVKVWNMNIPWTENPAGLIPSLFEDYTKFGSIDYIGSKEYFGYNSSLGQTDTDYVYYYNSFDEIVQVKPEEQKAIAIIHYTNQTIDFFYGEKFALEPYDVTNPEDTTGQARNFKLHIPWLMWHKNPECCFGQTFWVDPPGFEDKELFTVHYLKSTKNEDMNQPGMRYYHLWDTNPNSDGIPSRIGKVFPDSKLVIIDDEEIIAAMSYKSNRNWTLPAPQVSLITPNTCDTTTSATGILTGNSETMFITYRLTNDNEFTNSLHCNYYSKVIGNNNDCNPDTSKNIAIRFGPEFGCLIQPVHNHITTTTTTTTIPVCQRYEIINNGTKGVIVTFTPCCDETKTSPLSLPGLTGTQLCSSTDIDPISSAVTITNLGDCVGCTTTTTTLPQCDYYQITNTDVKSVTLTFTPCCGEYKTSPFTLPQSASTLICSSTIIVPSSSAATITNLGDCPSCVTTTTTSFPITTTTTTFCPTCDVPLGFYGNRFEILAQKVVTGTRPDSTKWRIIDFTPVISGTSINGYLTQNGITGSTFIISNENYDVAPYYNLNTFIPLTPNGNVGAKLNFGDEYYFYGALETDIQATIYEMKYKINLSSSEFQVSTNPSWTQGTTSYVTEIALLDENKDILVMSKLQSPTIRQGIQQYVIKIDL